MKNILIFGDSIAYGAWDTEGGWVQRLRTRFDEHNLQNLDDEVTLVYNLGISGDTSTDLVERFEHEARARTASDETTIIILAIGSNDATITTATNTPATSIETFTSNITTLIKQATFIAEAVSLVGLTPVDEARVNPVPWAPHLALKNSSIQQFDTILQDVAATTDTPYIDIASAFTKHNVATLLEDGDHPNSEGHAIIAATVWQHLTTAQRPS